MTSGGWGGPTGGGRGRARNGARSGGGMENSCKHWGRSGGEPTARPPPPRSHLHCYFAPRSASLPVSLAPVARGTEGLQVAGIIAPALVQGDDVIDIIRSELELVTFAIRVSTLPVLAFRYLPPEEFWEGLAVAAFPFFGGFFFHEVCHDVLKEIIDPTSGNPLALSLFTISVKPLAPALGRGH